MLLSTHSTGYTN